MTTLKRFLRLILPILLTWAGGCTADLTLSRGVEQLVLHVKPAPRAADAGEGKTGADATVATVPQDK